MSIQIHKFIKEITYVTGSFPELDIFLLRGKSEQYIEHYYWFNYTYVLYVDLPNKKEIIRFYQSADYMPVNSLNTKFIDYLKRPGINLLDIIYLCTVYGKLNDDDLFSLHSGSQQFINTYLGQTYGRLIYKWQAINLMKFYGGISHDSATLALNEINEWLVSRRPCLAGKIKIQDDYFFTHLFNEYALTRKVFNPNYKIAQTIYQLLK